MLPKYKPGDSVITFNWIGFPKIGEVVVAKWQQKLIIKRVTEIKNNSITLAGDNKASTSSEKLGQFKTPQIIGKVIFLF